MPSDMSDESLEASFRTLAAADGREFVLEQRHDGTWIAGFRAGGEPPAPLTVSPLELGAEASSRRRALDDLFDLLRQIEGEGG